jgi:hypothetical protein
VLAYSPHSFISPEQLQARIKRGNGAEDDVEQRLVDAVNAAALWVDGYTRRKLKARNHRSTVTIACSASSGSATVTGTGFSAQVEAGDDMAGAGLEVGSQVSSIESNSSLTANRKTTAALSGVDVTFGSEPLRLSGDGTSELYLTERPLVELFSLFYDVAGTLTAIDTTGARFEYDIGRIVLANDIFPKGTLNIVANARCGYAQPTATSLGSWQYAQLEQAALRCAEVFYLDAVQVRGRSQDFSAGGVSASFDSTDMPKDVLTLLAPFVRRWG